MSRKRGSSGLGYESGSLGMSSLWGREGILVFSENIMYPPYWRNKLLAIPFNRSLVLGPHEVRGINIPCRFPEGSLLQILGALPNRKVVFFLENQWVYYMGGFEELFSRTTTGVSKARSNSSKHESEGFQGA